MIVVEGIGGRQQIPRFRVLRVHGQGALERDFGLFGVILAALDHGVGHGDDDLGCVGQNLEGLAVGLDGRLGLAAREQHVALDLPEERIARHVNQQAVYQRDGLVELAAAIISDGAGVARLRRSCRFSGYFWKVAICGFRKA